MEDGKLKEVVMKKFIVISFFFFAVSFMGCARKNYLDTMDGVGDWTTFNDESSSINLTSIGGKKGNALQISYTLGEYGWVLIIKPLGIDMTQVNGIKFYYRGTGSPNTLEVKLIDDDDTNFGVLFNRATVKEKWTKIEIPFSSFTYWWGGDSNLDRQNIKEIQFAVSKKETDVGGSGTVEIDELEYISLK